MTSNPSGGTSTSPPPGTALLSPIPTRPTRRISSWYYGDGAALLNGVADGLQVFRSFPDRMTPLDSVLANPLADQHNGGSVGLRVSRDLTPRFAAEFNLDLIAAPLAVTRTAARGIETTSESFVNTFQSVLKNFPPVDASSSHIIQDQNGRQVAVTGALVITIPGQGRVIPFATVGAGSIWNRGDRPVVDLEGRYTFQSFVTPGNFWEETDTVTLRHSIDDRVFVGVFGGGMRWFLTQRSGIRVDVRVHVSRNTVQTLMSANPAVTPQSFRRWAFITTDPSVQFSSNPLNRFESSLSGPDITDFETFTVSKVRGQFLLSVGCFWRL